MKSVWPKSVVLLIAFLWASGALCSLQAQQEPEPAATAEDPLLLESRELFKALEEKKQEYDRIEGEITAASGEDKNGVTPLLWTGYSLVSKSGECTSFRGLRVKSDRGPCAFDGRCASPR